MEVLEFPNGICNRHGAKIAVNGIPTCIKCQADAERANRPAGPTVTVEDPGHEAMSDIKVVPQPTAVSAPAVVAKKGQALTMNEGLNLIKDLLTKLPMPSNMKQFKTIKKIDELVAKALSEAENG